MALEKKPFTSYTLDENKDPNSQTFTLRLTPHDKVWFEPAKKLINQSKNSTAMKQLAEIGATIVLHDPKLSKIIDIISNNKRRNKRIGIVEESPKSPQM